jgi:hypothetical protein
MQFIPTLAMSSRRTFGSHYFAVGDILAINKCWKEQGSNRTLVLPLKRKSQPNRLNCFHLYQECTVCHNTPTKLILPLYCTVLYYLNYTANSMMDASTTLASLPLREPPSHVTDGFMDGQCRAATHTIMQDAATNCKCMRLGYRRFASPHAGSHGLHAPSMVVGRARFSTTASPLLILRSTKAQAKGQGGAKMGAM